MTAKYPDKFCSITVDANFNHSFCFRNFSDLNHKLPEFNPDLPYPLNYTGPSGVPACGCADTMCKCVMQTMFEKMCLDMLRHGYMVRLNYTPSLDATEPGSGTGH